MVYVTFSTGLQIAYPNANNMQEKSNGTLWLYTTRNGDFIASVPKDATASFERPRIFNNLLREPKLNDSINRVIDESRGAISWETASLLRKLKAHLRSFNASTRRWV